MQHIVHVQIVKNILGINNMKLKITVLTFKNTLTISNILNKYGLKPMINNFKL